MSFVRLPMISCLVSFASSEHETTIHSHSMATSVTSLCPCQYWNKTSRDLKQKESRGVLVYLCRTLLLTLTFFCPVLGPPSTATKLALPHVAVDMPVRGKKAS